MNKGFREVGITDGKEVGYDLDHQFSGLILDPGERQGFGGS